MDEINNQKHIVIIGGGIIGCTTAYYLTRHPSYTPENHTITILEATRIAGGASGKAGGLLAVWAYPRNIVPLSFTLHRALALEHKGEERWGYRNVSCGNLVAHGRKRSEFEPLGELHHGLSLGKRPEDVIKSGKMRSTKGLPKDLNWVSPDLVRAYENIGGSKETAQVHPYQFTTSMMKLAEERGAKFVIGHVTEINYDSEARSSSTTPPPNGVDMLYGRRNSPSASSVSSLSSSSSSCRRQRVGSVTYINSEGKEVVVPASNVIIAAGPWTGKLFPSAPIVGLRAHSVTITPAKPLSAYALFTDITTLDNDYIHKASPEIYSRPNNEVYVCGEGDMEVDVPKTSAGVEVDEAKCDSLIAQVSSISDHIRLGRVTRKQACYLPVLDIGGSGGPLIGETGVEGLLLASGHSCWGINNAPATGLLLSEILFDGHAKSADIRQLDPRRVL